MPTNGLNGGYDDSKRERADRKLSFSNPPQTSPTGEGTQVERETSMEAHNAKINSRFDKNGVPN